MATPTQLRPQKHHFYSGRRTKSHDVSFINALCWKAEKGFKQDDPRRPNKMALLFAGRTVTRMWGWELKEDTYAWHLERLRTRYLTFKAILENLTFERDMEKNILHAPYDAWVALIRVINTNNIYGNPFADAYLKRGEPKWESLKLIFELNEEGRWGHGHEIVSISSGESDDNTYDDDEDDIASFGEEDKPDPDSVIDLATSDSD
ncbi:hypothetical protein Salat_1159600 [Sesamum alatum]|uniref:Uncharacterized protein n=1 Tax=Sesamum alatum TaxID=300844 RepID=A0AAE2CNE3_9LAMI|nr:hypothetical protein Salat_1159600 [Sesamum alatum]